MTGILAFQKFEFNLVAQEINIWDHTQRAPDRSDQALSISLIAKGRDGSPSTRAMPVGTQSVKQAMCASARTELC